jgi:WG containing repeat
MTNILSKTLFILFLCLFNNAQAQNSSEIVSPKKLMAETPIVTAKSVNQPGAIEEARRRFKMLFNIYRDFSITIDTISQSQEVILSQLNEEAKTPNFGDYLAKMTTILTKKADKIVPNNRESRAERSHYLAGLNTLKSAKCLESDNQQKSFIRTRDMDNNALMAFELDVLRHSNRYGQVENYREGFARIRKDQVYGFLNLCGDEVIICQYERAEPFNLGQALVKRVDWLFVDGEGNESEPLENVVEAKALKQGVSLVRLANGKQALIDNNYATSKVSLSQYYDAIDSFYKKEIFKVRNGKKIGLIGLDGKTLFDAIYDNIEPTNLSHVFRMYQNGSVGLLDTTWVTKAAPQYDLIGDFNSYGIAKVKNKIGTSFINAHTFKMSKFYKNTNDFNEFGVATISNEANLYGLIDTNLAIIVAPKYASIGFFNDLGLAPACYPDGKCGFIKYDGKEQIKANYESVSNFNAFGLAVARTMVEDCGGKNTPCKVDVIIDRNGNTIVPVTDEATTKKWRYQLTDSLHSERFIVVKILDENTENVSGYMLIQKENLQLVTTTAYRTIMPMDILGNIRVEVKGKWGMIDSTGKTLSKPLYQDIKRVNESHYATQNDKGKWGFLNKKGKPQIPFEYEEVRSYRFGYAPVSQGRGKWGLINHFNAKIVPCAFRSVVLNEAETKFQITDEDNTVFILNEKGECETNCPKLEQLRAKANRAN